MLRRAKNRNRRQPALKSVAKADINYQFCLEIKYRLLVAATQAVTLFVFLKKLLLCSEEAFFEETWFLPCHFTAGSMRFCRTENFHTRLQMNSCPS